MKTVFSDDYQQARIKFLKIAHTRASAFSSAVHPQRGLKGEELAVDFALFGRPEAARTLLIISGTHGLEGLVGSAMQIAFLQDVSLTDDVNVLAVHALSPWAVSHFSRTDEKNIDVNRNFIDFSKPLHRNETYSKLHSDLCPSNWDEQVPDFDVIFKKSVAQHGLKNTVNAVTAGQREEPTGLNFVGNESSWSRRALEQFLPDFLRSAKKVVFIDWHTGMGDYGQLCHVCLEKDPKAYERWFDWMGEEARLGFERAMPGAAEGPPDYEGPLGSWLPSAAPQAEWTGAVIEVGTFDIKTVADALRIDRWLKYGDASADIDRAELRQSMKDRLLPMSREWRQAALANGLEAQNRALQGLLNWN